MGNYIHCDYCMTVMSEYIPILKVYHPGKLGGQYLCMECLTDRERRNREAKKRKNYLTFSRSGFKVSTA